MASQSEGSNRAGKEPARVTDLLDKYGSYRRAAQKSAILVLVVSITLAALSRSPTWTLDPPGLGPVKVASPPVGTASQLMPVYGPLVVWLVCVHFYCVLSAALGLRKAIRRDRGETESNRGEDAIQELLSPPLLALSARQNSCLSRLTAYLAVCIWCITPLICYIFLFSDFCLLRFDGKVITRGYELFYTFRGWTGIWPTQHHGVSGGIPPVFPIWQPWFYAAFLLHTLFLTLDAIRRILTAT
jgi:hypothetical protein